MEVQRVQAVPEFEFETKYASLQAVQEFVVEAEDIARSQFWKGPKHDPEYWRLYLKRRPGYDQPFYRIIINFHNENATIRSLKKSFAHETAHDFATGPGQVADYLAHHFLRVIASDINETHLASARHFQRWNNIEFIQAGGEQVARQFPNASAGLVTIAEALPLMQPRETVDSAAKLLCPGGTLAIWFYGRPHFAPDSNDPDFDSDACNQLYGEIATSAFHHTFIEVLKVPKEQVRSIRSTMASMANWLDHVDLPEHVWAKVQRCKWNTGLKMEFIDQTDPLLGWNNDLGSHIAEGERIDLMPDQNIWSNMWTAKAWEEFLKINLPPFDAGTYEDMGLAPKWNRLAELMGGHNVLRKVRWPVVLILATRR